MQAATAVPYPFSIPLMVAAGLAGALALAQASSASGMSSSLTWSRYYSVFNSRTTEER